MGGLLTHDLAASHEHNNNNINVNNLNGRSMAQAVSC
jgi:hypothetical protein